MKNLLKFTLLACCTLTLSAFITGCTKKKPALPSQLTAKQYLNLADEAAPADQPMYELAAANKYIEQQQPDQARSVLNNLNTNTTPQQDVDKQLLEAKVALLDGQAQLALQTLIKLQASNVILSTEQNVTLHQLLANTYEAVGNTQASIDQRSQLQSLITDPQAKRTNLIAIWHILQTQSIAQLNTDLTSNSTANLKGWVSLALIIKQSKTPNELIQNLRQWKSTYPDHPAITLLPQNIEQEINKSSSPKNIALLLPLRGRLAKTGTAIRNGFLAAYYAAEKHQINIPHLKVYNTAGTDIVSTYQKAVQNGATLIVGPLLKSNLKKLISTDTLNTPTLALNTLADAPANNKYLFQFGLSPLDEAQQAADRAWKQGQRNAVIIAANSPWGQSIANVFTNTWTNLGGKVITQVNVAPTDSLNQQVAKVLRVDLANQDYNQLHDLLHTRIRFLPRRRKDIDMVYMVADPNTARQIAPLLRYYYAGDIPVYSISQIYNGQDNPKAGHDLNGVYFCDMPWVLSPDQESQQLQQLRQQIETIWPLSYSRHKKLYALGIDAYKVSAKLQQMETLPQFAINGATGSLYLDQAQHIYRQLQWARFSKNGPVVIH